MLTTLWREVTDLARALRDVAAMDDPLLCGCTDTLLCSDCSPVAAPAPAATWG